MSRILQYMFGIGLFFECLFCIAPVMAQEALPPRDIHIVVKYDQNAPMPTRGLENGSGGACSDLFRAEFAVGGLGWLNSSTGFINWQAVALATDCQTKVEGTSRMSEISNTLCLVENTPLRLGPWGIDINLMDVPKVTADMEGKTIICNGRIDPLINPALGCIPFCRWE